MNFGDNLKKLRKAQKISQEELADRMQVSRQSVSKWETGEAYPEMNNILELCRIFHCQINDLVNDSILDVDNFNEEVQTRVVKFQQTQQTHMKVLSRIISVLAKIGRIVCMVAIPLVAITMISSGLVVSRTEITDNQITLRGDGLIQVTETNDELFLKVNNLTVASIKGQPEILRIKSILTQHPKALIIAYLEIGFFCLIVSLVLVIILLRALENLFNNIRQGDTPFTLENVGYIKKMAYLMIALTIFPNLIGALFELLLQTDLDIGFEMFNFIEILFLFSIAYIFQYGHEIQLDSRGKMYGDENE